jgi:hypothetical protein
MTSREGKSSVPERASLIGRVHQIPSLVFAVTRSCQPLLYPPAEWDRW